MLANMSTMPSSASRLGTKLEIHHGVAPLQSNTGGVACAQITEKPNRKPYCVNRVAETFGICNSTPHRFSAAVATRREGHRSLRSGRAARRQR